jgi:2-polyprenyl-3-methyl-5-hydroxy-6-metoxy-1,4-benzoquinol methylase
MKSLVSRGSDRLVQTGPSSACKAAILAGESCGCAVRRTVALVRSPRSGFAVVLTRRDRYQSDRKTTTHRFLDKMATNSELASLKYDFERAELLPFVPKDARALLDVGCGSGAFGRLVRSQRPQVELWAVEPDLASARAAEDIFDHVVVGTFPSELLPASRFDVVLCADVLEHMVEPADALRAAVKLMVPGGIMVASVPNIRHWRTALWPLLGHGTWTYTERGVLDRTHLRFFTRRSMRDFFISNGWSVDSVTGINMIRREKLLSTLTGRCIDDFLHPQYVVVARPMPGAS